MLGLLSRLFMLALPGWLFQAGIRAAAAALGRGTVVRWASRFRQLARDDERLPETVAGLHFVAFACLMVKQLVALTTQSP
jgi:hypothetical protein